MIKAELILDTRTKAKKGFPVKIRIYCDITRTHKYIPLKIYQNSTQLIVDSNLRKRNFELDNEVKFCNDNFYKIEDALNIIKNGVPLDDLDIEIQTLEKRLELLKAKRGLNSSIGFINFTNKLIKEREVLNIPTESYKSIINTITNFIYPSDDFPINNITVEWLKSFDLFYKNKNVKDSSIYTYLILIKAIYKEAQSRESLNIKSDNPFNKLRSFNKHKKETELTIKDLVSMYKLDENNIKTKSHLGKSWIKTLIDIYLFQFAIGGHDLLEVANLKWSNIIDNRIVFKRRKNRFKKYGGPEVNNMLNDFALNVISKYGDKNNERIFSFIPDPVSDMQKYNVFVHTLNTSTFNIISRNISSDNKFTTKSTRYLFRTEAGNLLINDLIIVKLQGHKLNGITFGYQGALNHEVQDREHQKILDLVFKF